MLYAANHARIVELVNSIETQESQLRDARIGPQVRLQLLQGIHATIVGFVHSLRRHADKITEESRDAILSSLAEVQQRINFYEELQTQKDFFVHSKQLLEQETTRTLS